MLYSLEAGQALGGLVAMSWLYGQRCGKHPADVLTACLKACAAAVRFGYAARRQEIEPLLYERLWEPLTQTLMSDRGQPRTEVEVRALLDRIAAETAELIRTASHFVARKAKKYPDDLHGIRAQAAEDKARLRQEIEQLLTADPNRRDQLLAYLDYTYADLA